MRLAVLLACAAPAAAQDSVTASTYGVPLVDEVHLDSYADFRQSALGGDWSRAFRAVAAQIDAPPAGLLPARDGVALSFRETLWRDLVALQDDGRRAFRLFYDARAERAWREAQRVRGADRATLLTALHDQWFVTSVGDQATDALAREAFAAGDAARAARLWREVLDHHPDTDLDKLALRLDLLAALAAAHRAGELEELREAVGLRYAGRTVERDGARIAIEDFLASLSAAGPRAAATDGHPPRLPLTDDPVAAWRFELPTLARPTGSWYGDPRATETDPLPAALLVEEGAGATLALSRGGVHWLLDVATGEPRWTAGTACPDVWPGQLRGRDALGLADGRLHATADLALHDLVLSLQLCALDPADGRRLWATSDDPQCAGAHTFLGVPLAHGGALFAVSQGTDDYNLTLWRFDAATGDVRWSVPIGAPGAALGARTQHWSGGPSLLEIRPSLAATDDELYVLTDAGAVLAVDPADGAIRWAHVRPVDRTVYAPLSPASSLLLDGVLYLRGQGSARCVALDVAERRELWSAQVGPDERLVAADAERLFLVGASARALDRRTGERLWSRPVLVPDETRHVVLTETYVYVLTRRGVYELDVATGDAGRRPVRGAWTDLAGGDLYFDGRYLTGVGVGAALAVDLAR